MSDLQSAFALEEAVKPRELLIAEMPINEISKMNFSSI